MLRGGTCDKEPAKHEHMIATKEYIYTGRQAYARSAVT